MEPLNAFQILQANSTLDCIYLPMLLASLLHPNCLLGCHRGCFVGAALHRGSLHGGAPHQKSGPVKELRAFPITVILRTPYSPFKPLLSLKEQIQLGQHSCNKIPCSLTDDMVGSVQGSFSFSVHPWTCFSQVLGVLWLCPAGEEDLSLVACRVLFTHPSGTQRSGWQHTVCQSFPACCVLKALFCGCGSAVSSCHRSLSVRKRSLAQSFARASVSTFLL